MDAGAATPETPAPVRALLAWWVPRARRALGTAYRTMLVHGSVATGDFQPGWSDVDICVVRRGEVGVVTKTEALQRAIAAGGPAAEAYALGLAVRRKGSATAVAHSERLRRAFDTAATLALEVLRGPD